METADRIERAQQERHQISRRVGWRVRPARTFAYAALSIFLGIALWQLAATLWNSVLLPGPIIVFTTLLDSIASGQWLAHAQASLTRVAIGFALGVSVSIPAGFVMGWYQWAQRMLEPWVQFFRTIPPLALIPLVIVLLGIGEEAKIFVVFFAAFLGSVVVTYEGVRSVDRTLINAARVLGANDRTIFWRVVVPASSPYLMVGMRIALANSWGVLVAAELIAAPSGFGKMMQTAQLFFDVPTIMVGIVSIGVVGFLMDRAIQRLDRRLTGWQERR